MYSAKSVSNWLSWCIFKCLAPIRLSTFPVARQMADGTWVLVKVNWFSSCGTGNGVCSCKVLNKVIVCNGQ